MKNLSAQMARQMEISGLENSVEARAERAGCMSG